MSKNGSGGESNELASAEARSNGAFGSEYERMTDDVTEAERMAGTVLRKAASLGVVKIDRSTFLRSELAKRCPEVDADDAVRMSPAAAGVAPAIIDEAALAAIDFEVAKCAGLSFLAGVPGAAAMVGTVPADLAQYFAHVMRVEQKLAYLYGWQSFLDEDDELDDVTLANLVMLMGVMLGVGSAASGLSKYAAEVAQHSVSRVIQRQALTKTAFYNPMKRILGLIGIKVTKQSFGAAVGKVVPLVGGAVSGGMTYASFKPGAERLRRYLRSLPVSGIDEDEFPDQATLRSARRRERADAMAQEARDLGARAVSTAGATIGEGIGAVRRRLLKSGGADAECGGDADFVVDSARDASPEAPEAFPSDNEVGPRRPSEPTE